MQACPHVTTKACAMLAKGAGKMLATWRVGPGEPAVRHQASGVHAPVGMRAYICQHVYVRLAATSAYRAALAPRTAPSATPSARFAGR